MEDKIIELENRIKKLETILENIEFSGDGLNITFNQTLLTAVKISGDGANVDFNNSPIGYAQTGNAQELDDLEDMADDLQCRIDDIKCAAEDVKTILKEIEPKIADISKITNRTDEL